MYKVYMDDFLFYNDEVPLEEYKLISPTVKFEASAAGSFEFTMIPSNRAYDKITFMKGEVKVYKNDQLFWVGRAVSQTVDFYKQKTIYCEGILSYLNDVLHPAYVYRDQTVMLYLDQCIKFYNEKVQEDYRKVHHIKYPHEESETLDTVWRINKDVELETFLDEISEFAENYNLQYRMRRSGERNNYLEFINAPDYSGQTIVFGTNMLSYSANTDLTDFASVIYPIGAQVTDDEGTGEVQTEWGGVQDITNQLVFHDGKSILVHPAAGTDHDKPYVTMEDDEGHFVAEYAHSLFGATRDVKIFITAKENDGRALYAALTDKDSKEIHRSKSSKNFSANDVYAFDDEIIFPSGYADTYPNSVVWIGGYGDHSTVSLWRDRETWETKGRFSKNVTVADVNNRSPHVIGKSSNVLVTTFEQGDINHDTGEDTNDEATDAYVVRTKDPITMPGQINPYYLKVFNMKGLHIDIIATDPDTGEVVSVTDNQNDDSYFARVGYSNHTKKTQNLRFVFKYVKENTPLSANDIQANAMLTDGIIDPQKYETPYDLLSSIGWIEKTVDFQDITDPSQLLEAAKSYLLKHQYADLTLELTAIDMTLLGVETDSIEILKSVRVIAPPFGLDEYFTVTSIEVPLDSPENTVYTLGINKHKTLSQTVSSNSKRK